MPKKMDFKKTDFALMRSCTYSTFMDPRFLPIARVGLLELMTSQLKHNQAAAFN